MRTILVLVSCLALSAFGYVRAQDNPPQKKKSTKTEETSPHPQGPKTYQAPPARAPQRFTQTQHNPGIGRTGFQRPSQTTTMTRGRTLRSASTATGGTRTFTARHFNVASKSKPSAAVAPAVTFKQGAHIAGSQHWTGTSYTAFRTYTPVWHDQGWWHSHYNNIVFVFGGWYYWNAGYWYPAWGYAPNSYYFYDGPIYAYNDLPPDQVIANVQQALADQGYYPGPIDGILGPLTRAGIARYQQDHGLYVTSAIDEPTLASLGMV